MQNFIKTESKTVIVKQALNIHNNGINIKPTRIIQKSIPTGCRKIVKDNLNKKSQFRTYTTEE